MLHWALILFLLAVVSAIVGFGGISSGAAGIAQVCFFAFIVLFIVTLMLGVMRRGDVAQR